MERGRREARGMESRSEPAGAVPPSPAARAQGARDSAADARCRCGGSCCSCGWASGSGRVALGAGRRGAAAPATRSHSPQAAAAAQVSHQYSRAAPGVESKSKEESEAHRRCARRSPRLRRPAALLQSRPAGSARISCGYSARASYLRPGLALATEHAQCRSMSPAQRAAPARFHFSGLWRRLRGEAGGARPGGGGSRERRGRGGGLEGGGGPRS